MDTSIRRAAQAAALALALAGAAAHASSLTYHGGLRDGGEPANGRYDLRITLYGNEHAVAPLDDATLYGVEVRDGHFRTEVDFATGTPAADAWLGVAVRKAGDGEFVELAGRSEVNGADACWSTTGNAGLGPGSFIGPLDNQPLVMRVGDRFGAGIRWYADGVSFEVGNAGAGAARAAAFNKGLAYAVDSFAGGSSGTVDSAHSGSFIWGGRPFTDDAHRVHTGGANQFVVYADGGLLVNASTLPSGNDDLVLAPRATGDADADLRFVTRGGVNTGLIYVRDNTGIMQIGATNGVQINNPVGIDGDLKLEGSASKSTAGAWQANSDGRIKQDILPVEDALATLAAIHPVTFRYTEAYREEHPGVADQRYYNVIAQQFAEVFPEAVTKSGEYLPGADRTADNEILQVDTYPAQIVTIAAVQELARRNATLQGMVQRLSARIARLEASGEK
jgi:hypothetical protein